MLKFILIFAIFFLNSFNLFASEQTLTLVYKDIGKPPYMQVSPDNSGLYFDIMKKVSQKIGFNLKVMRLPKKRTYKLLENGHADLYASGEFKNYRSKILYYFPNGLNRIEHYYGMTAVNIPEITSISQIKEYNLTWMLELGSSWPLKAKTLGINFTEIRNSGVANAVKISQLNRPTFFIVQKKNLLKYMKKNQIKSLDELGIKIHKNCCKSKIAPLYTGFSRFSPHYKEEPNLEYDKTKPLSQTNFPFKLSKDSTAYKFEHALKQMIESGKIEKLKAKYSIK